MNDEFDKVTATAQKSQERAAEVVEKIFDAAQPSAVYGEPIVAGPVTVDYDSESRLYPSAARSPCRE